MITNCPHCGTAFQITAEQLSAKAGLVRCGACRQVFNGYRGLTLTGSIHGRPAGAETPAPETPTENVLAGDAPHMGPAASLVVPLPEVAPVGAPAGGTLLLPLEPTDASVPAAIAEAEALLAQDPAAHRTLDLEFEFEEEAPQAAPPAGAHGEARPPESAVTPTASETARAAEPLYLPELHVARRAPAWFVGGAALLLLLASQSVYFWRSAIAQAWPQTRGYLEGVCASLGCEVAPAQELTQLNIESSTLEADASRPGVVVLQATLQNVAPFVQRYPHLQLTLTGVNDEVLGIKTFAPHDYLPAEHDAKRGWLPKQTRAVEMHLDVSALPPVGFRLRLLYP
jgi:predicted Zn finger-like uncharacterized protein